MHSQSEVPDAIARLWGRGPTRSRGPRARAGLSQIADAGIGIADHGGLAAVTLAAVARQLDLTTTALYRYVDSKETLVEIMVDQSLGQPVEHSGSWREQAMGWCSDLFGRYTQHGWLTQIHPTAAPRCPNALAWIAQIMEYLTHGRIGDPLNLALTLDIVVRGFAALDYTAAAAAPPPPSWLSEKISDHHPILVGPGRELDIQQELHRALQRLLR
jgi:AcrR family transcriptional regulator